MKKNVAELIKKDVKVLQAQVRELRTELTKLDLGAKANPQKDVNLVSKKKKLLAVILTVLSQKRLEVKKP